MTGAQFFEAKDKASLESIYDEIDRLEKSEVEMGVNALLKTYIHGLLGPP